MHSPRAARWAGSWLLLAALILYLATLDNGLRVDELAGGDLITHQYAQVQARPGNAPGYPLYTLGGWLWFHGWRALLGPHANATAILSGYSTLWALPALALLYALLWHATRRWPLALLFSCFYAVTYFFWYYAVSSEQYASAVAQTLALIWLAWRWEALVTAQGGGSSRGSDRLLLGMALLLGLSLAHMITVAVIGPPLLAFIISRQPGVLRRGRLIAAAIGVALLPLLSYAFIYLRGDQHPEWRGAGEWPTTWAWFTDFISTGQGRAELTWTLHPLWVNGFPGLIVRELGWIVLVAGLMGLLLLPRRRGLLLGGSLALYLALSFIDRQGNWFQVIMPAYPLLVIAAARLIETLWRTAERRWPTHLAGGVMTALLLLLVLTRAAQSWPETNQRNQTEDHALDAGQAILASAPAADAAVVATDEEARSLLYLTVISGARPDVTSVNSVAARALLTEGSRPLYVTVSAAPLLHSEIGIPVHLGGAGDRLIAVRAEPVVALPADAQAVEQIAGDGLMLAGVQFSSTIPWKVRLYWRADSPISHDWSISVRPTVQGQPLADGAGGIVLRDALHPVQGAYPMSAWTTGEVVADDYTIALPESAQPDGVQVVVYRALPEGGFENLAVLQVARP
ncbi:MAG: DUF2723 domain-containing protein [Caldilineales bacterium]